jgi:nucleoredoxin
VSLDENKQSFDSYYEEMPWLTISFEESELKETLSTKYEVDGIPSLIMFDIDGTIINQDAVTDCDEDPQGEKFPWKKK